MSVDGPLIYLIAGEPSGDALGADLMAGLKAQFAGRCRFAGIGGDGMAAEGLESLFPMSELTVMGLAEVLPRIPALLGRISDARDDILAKKPDAVITVDAPDFSFRVARGVKQAAPGIPLIHYVAPTVWAWRPGRAKKVAGFLDHLFCLFPFEPPYFEREGLAATFVGHPIANQPTGGDAEAFRRKYGIGDDEPALLILPGSRRGELARLLPVFGDVLMRLKAEGWRGRVVAPTLSRLADDLNSATKAWAYDIAVVTDREDKAGAFAAARAALAASGTVVLELAAAGVPSVVAYRVNPVTAALGRRLLNVRHVGLVNILRGKAVMPEFLQENCRSDLIAPELHALLTDDAAHRAQTVEFAKAMADLKASGGTPAATAAGIVAEILAGKA